MDGGPRMRLALASFPRPLLCRDKGRPARVLLISGTLRWFPKN